MAKFSLSQEIRTAARTILKDNQGRLTLSILKRHVEKKLGKKLRSDFFKASLECQGGSIEVYKNIAILKNKPKRTQGGNKMPGATKKTTPRKRGRPKKLTVEEFVLLAIEKLRKPKYKSIHAVYSGFNQAFRQYFPGKDPVKEVQKLEKKGVVTTRPTKGGVLIFAGKVEAPDTADSALSKMGL